MNWRLHWLEAEDDLTHWRAQISDEVTAAYDAISRLVILPQIDVLIQRVAGAVIPETGTMGQAYRPGLFSLTVDPDNPNFASSLDAGDLRRTAAHEAHHCLRMASTGYGETLGESLVSEGLAGQFVRHLFENPPDPWEDAMDDETMAAHLPDAAQITAAHYDHGDWFFGTGRRPRWLGYTLGYKIVGDWLTFDPPREGSRWVNVPAADVIAASRLSPSRR